MKKIFAILLAALMIITCFAACSSNEAPAPTSTPDPTPTPKVNPMDSVLPLNESTKLVVGQQRGTVASAVSFIIEKLGGYKKANIDISYSVFTNGNVLAQSADFWDVATYDINGIFRGIANENTYILGAASHDAAFKIYSRKDNDIASQGDTVDGYPSLLGSGDSWSAKSFVLTKGTAAHAFFRHCLNALGIKEEAVKIQNMDALNILNAFESGEGEAVVVCPPESFLADLDSTYTLIADSIELEFESISCIAASKKSFDNDSKNAAIEKYVELYYRAVEWIYEDEENLNKAAEWFDEWRQACGADADSALCLELLKKTPAFSIADAAMLNGSSKTVDGKQMNGLQAAQYEMLQLMVELEKFDAALLEAVAGEDYFKAETLDNAFSAIG